MLHVHSMLFTTVLAALALCLVALLAQPLLGWRRGRRERAAIAALAGAVREDEPDARTRFAALARALGADDAGAEEHAGDLLRRQKTMLKEIIRVYAARDAAGLGALHEAVRQQFDPVDALAASAPAPQAAEGDDETARELEAARAHNQRLSQELEITRQTMNNMLTEYAQMYERGDEAANASRHLADDADTGPAADLAAEAPAGEGDDAETGNAGLTVA